MSSTFPHTETIIRESELQKIGKCKELLDRLKDIFEPSTQKKLVDASEYEFWQFAQDVYEETDNLDVHTWDKIAWPHYYILTEEFYRATSGLTLHIGYVDRESDNSGLPEIIWIVGELLQPTPAARRLTKQGINPHLVNWITYN